MGAKEGDERLIEEGGERTRGMGEEEDMLCRGAAGEEVVVEGKGVEGPCVLGVGHVEGTRGEETCKGLEKSGAGSGEERGGGSKRDL